MKFFFISLIILSNISWGSENSSLDNFYDQYYLGEKKTFNYLGPKDNRTFFNSKTGYLSFLDSYYYERFNIQNIQSEAFELNSFWNDKILDKSTCPDIDLAENWDYIRYLYRLLTISYTFESIKLNHQILSELKLDNQYCTIKYDDLFASCHPKSDDMKKFKERVYGKFVNEIEKTKYNTFSTKETEMWMNLFHLSTINNEDPTLARIHLQCERENRDCKKLKVSDIQSELNIFCQKDIELLKNICNETDSLYGISFSEVPLKLIIESNAFGLINTKGMGEECLRRFSRINTPREMFNNDLKFQFASIYKNLKKENARFMQGNLFLPGSLKEFDMKGLGDFLTALRPPKVEPIKVVAVAPKVPAKTIPKVVKKIEVKKIEPILEVKPEPVVEELPTISEFERAVESIKLGKTTVEKLDMDKFRSDFEFTSKMISTLAIPIKKFQTRQALKDMKDYDHFGSDEAPVGILFLKYLIDTENHQGIYNVISVLGEKFYIVNDYEHKKDAIYAELKNDASTKNHWQIILYKNPAKK